MSLSPPPLRILFADDNRLLADILILLLQRAGHTVEHVPDGLEAWDRLGKDIGQFDLVITDHDMPHLNGLELVELLRQASYGGRIIVHSSSLTAELRQRYETLGVSRIVRKASHADELLAAVAERRLENARVER